MRDKNVYASESSERERQRARVICQHPYPFASVIDDVILLYRNADVMTDERIRVWVGSVCYAHSRSLYFRADQSCFFIRN